jgi:hypothetical protein
MTIKQLIYRILTSPIFVLGVLISLAGSVITIAGSILVSVWGRSVDLGGEDD